MNKNIVVFGCDNSGKSTFCKRLKKYLGEFPVEVVHSIGANKKYEEYYNFMKENIESQGITIFDRFPIIEEETTGIILRGRSMFDIKDNLEVKKIDELFRKIDLFVFCYPGIEAILNWGNREQMNGVKDNIYAIVPLYISYALLLKKNGREVIEYNYKITEEEETISWDSESDYEKNIFNKIVKELNL